MNRRQWLQQSSLAALVLGAGRFLPESRAADDPSKRGRLLMYTRSVGFQHSVVARKGGELALAERIVTELGKKNNIDVVCEKDGRIFESAEFPKFDGFLFETQGDLLSEKSLDNSPPMTQAGKKALLDAVAGGKGFIGCHCASDTFHSKGAQWQNQNRDQVDPYLAMVGGEFIRHGEQQKAWMRVVDPNFPGIKDQKDFEMHEEWYSLKNFAPDLHVILVQDTQGMRNPDYQRPKYPATWARKHEKGRVFFTSMGHREDVWQSEIMKNLLTGALAWTLGRVDAEVKPNLKEVAPHASELPRVEPRRKR
ncbi:MAG TPA: ThuA domain-containing protein [Gemmataceae bacterium]|nr:ThuA domain-containing protein [Gemmataceae bacterium]